MAFADGSRREVWFLTGSQSLYGPETLEQVAEQSQQIFALLGGVGRCGGAVGLEAGVVDG